MVIFHSYVNVYQRVIAMKHWMSRGIIEWPVSYFGFILDSHLWTTVWLEGILHSQSMSISHWRNHEFSKDQTATAKAEPWNSVLEIRQTPWHLAISFLFQARCDMIKNRIYIQLVHWLSWTWIQQAQHGFKCLGCEQSKHISSAAALYQQDMSPTLMGWSTTSPPVRCWCFVL